MTVLCEATSVIVRVQRVLEVFGGDLASFYALIPNRTLCADGVLFRVGFMHPDDVHAFIRLLEGHGLEYLSSGEAIDMIVVDQLTGPAASCDWINFGHINLEGDPRKRVTACELVSGDKFGLFTPDGWQFEGSLSQTYYYSLIDSKDKAVQFLRRQGGLHVYRSLLTGKEVFMGRTERKQ